MDDFNQVRQTRESHYKFEIPKFRVSHNSVVLLDWLTTIQHPFLNSKVPSRDRVNTVVAKFKG